ncbi:oplophorus-luciferin 2-monooxygenase non-catalytic subunit-like isoform X2 [Portunus trituberculatus]|uniref:oplophorus-luciferin 2-monooxygenase non-catalytic subunit-like isoform X2 n=1 Tax=Portunus trituberculatus TaxID=210409 RepID=UPI001E1CFB42|nr:oplophorus-luciferin 2-monooxygenase non-catalytic subunit-like isoform X2 [Portunus trituberculatus]
MDMNCSAVTSSNQLALIFSKHFPFNNFKNLFIIGNTAIRALRFGDLGDATFEMITISGGTLESVVSGALTNSHDTLVHLDLSENHLIDFPFDEIVSFKRIETLKLRNNALHTFPHLTSSTLRFFFIGYNPLKTISSSALKNLPNLEQIGLHFAEFSSAGTFVGIPKLRLVHLEGNQLTTLRANTIKLTGTDTWVHLNSNKLVSIEVNAISGVIKEVWINDNQLTELNEDVWRQMFDDDIQLYAKDNPFTCGCDIAWIVLNVNYLNNLIDDPTCESKTPISDLDPVIFNELCT